MRKVFSILICLVVVIKPVGGYAQSDLIDQLHIELSQSKTTEDSIHWLNELSWEHTQVYDLETALTYGELAKELSLFSKSISGLATAYSRIGQVYYTMSSYDLAYSHHIKALNLKAYLGDRKGVAASAQNIGNIFQGQTKLPEAIHFYMLSLKIKEELDDKRGIGNTMNSLGNVYKDQGKFEKAIQLYKQALAIRHEINDSAGIGYSLSNIGIAYGMSGNMEKALEYTQQSLFVLQKIGDIYGESACYASLALIYQHMDKGDLSKSIYYNELSLALYEKMQDKRGVTMVYTNIGNLYALLNNRLKAEEYLLKGLTLAQDIEVLDYIKGIHYNLYELYEKTGELQKAIVHLKAYDAVKDSLYKDETAFLLEGKLAAYANQKKEQEFKLQLVQVEHEKLQQEAKLERQFFLLLFFIVVVVVLVMFSWLFYRANQRQKMANIALQEQKNLVDRKNQENETLMAEIHHRVKNNLQVISSLLSLQGKNTTDKELQMAIDESRQRVKSMELVHKMLYEGHTFMAIPLHEYFKKLANVVLEVFAQDDEINVSINASNVKLDIEEVIPLGLIVNELLTNSLKHNIEHDRKLKISLTCTADNEYIRLRYADNGEATSHTVNAMNNASFGMKLIGLLVKQLNAEMEVSEAEGLVYNITLPIKK
jgi:two-component system, sensor histidine kinase PdtaS